MSSKSASTLLNVVKNFNAGDVMEFTAQKKAVDHVKDRNFSRADEARERRPPSSVIFIK